MTSDKIRLTLLYFARLQEVRGLAQEEVFVTSNSTPQSLYRQLAARYQFDLAEEKVRAARNHVFLRLA